MRRVSLRGKRSKYRNTWYNGFFTTTGATGTAVGDGQANTAAIIANQGVGSYAAGLAKAYTGGGYTDWFLPSKDELHEMYLNKATIDITALANSGSGFASNSYWSSTEFDSDDAWAQNFVNGSQGNYFKIFPYYVRAVRAF